MPSPPTPLYVPCPGCTGTACPFCAGRGRVRPAHRDVWELAHALCAELDADLAASVPGGEVRLHPLGPERP